MLSYPTFEGYSRKIMTLTMIIKNDEVLLGMKNRGIGTGKWNGFGGKVEPNETIDDAAKREVKEECGLDVLTIEKIGIIDFEFSGSKELMEGHIYICDSFSGNIVESDEMAPINWFKVKNLPNDKMWMDDKFWFPMILKRTPFRAHFKYLNDDTMLDRTIILLDSPQKTKETLVNVVVKNNSKILIHKNANKFNYLNKHEQIAQGESIESAASRCLNNLYGINSNQIHKIAVVNIEFIDKSCIQEINVFVVDVSEDTNSSKCKDFQWLDIKNITVESTWPDNKFFLTLLTMKQFKAYFLINEDDVENIILSSKYII